MSTVIDFGGVPSEIYRSLRERILKGELKSGSQIKIGAVADEFGVSIIPVREALRMLEADHLVEIIPRRSPVVSGLAPEEVLEIGQIRLALEPVALAAAIPHMSKKTIQDAGAVLERYGQSTDPWQQVELNRRFHLTLYEPCGMPRLLRLISDQYDGMTRCAQVMVIRSTKDIDKSLSEHKAILRACKAKNADVALSKLRVHLESSIERLREEMTVAE